MKTKFILIFSLLVSYHALAQPSFPKSWQGNWAGTLEIFNASGKLMEITMELLIQPTEDSSRYSWTIIYGENREAGKRSYELVILDREAGRYALDEKNSIVLESYLIGGRFYHWFEVEGNLLLTINSLEGDELVWELVGGNTEPVSTTGNKVVDGLKIPPVKSFAVKNMQLARLKRT